jgi:hypothetical protein
MALRQRRAGFIAFFCTIGIMLWLPGSYDALLSPGVRRLWQKGMVDRLRQTRNLAMKVIIANWLI